MKSRYRLIALDMDGTVLDEEKRISSRNKEAIRAAVDAGIIVMFATGRGYMSAMPYVRELHLQSPLITVNGSEIWLGPGKLYKRHLMEHETILRLRQLALENDVWYWAYTVEGVVNRENWEENTSTDWLKFGFYTEEPDKLKTIRETVTQLGSFEITNSHPYNIELNPKGVSKAEGLREICKQLGIGMHETVTVGDSLNDLEMIRASGLGVAMENAQETVKQEADWITKSNEEDGVAEVILNKVLNQK